MTPKRKLAIAVAVILLVFVGAAIYLQTEYNYIGLGSERGGNIQVTTRPEIEVITQPSSPRVRVGRSETVSVDLKSTSESKPTAFDLTFDYDSSLVEVINIVPGRLWSSANVLKKEIDNENGRARLAAGQGFSAKETGSLDIAEIEYRVLNPGQVVFSLSKGSIFAFVGEDQTSVVTSEDVVIQAVN